MYGTNVKIMTVITVSGKKKKSRKHCFCITPHNFPVTGKVLCLSVLEGNHFVYWVQSSGTHHADNFHYWNVLDRAYLQYSGAGVHISWLTAICMVAPNNWGPQDKIPSYYPFGAKNFEVVPSCLENMWNFAVQSYCF
jgi:hypothetical protein